MSLVDFREYLIQVLTTMEFKEIEQKLWSEFLNRLQIEKNATSSADVVFILDKSTYEGVRLYDFQDKALEKLRSLGAIISMREYKRQTQMMRIIEEIHQHVNPSLPDGYVIRFSDDKFKLVLTRLRHSLARGDIHEEPMFELYLDNLKLMVADLACNKKYVVHKMKLDSPTQDVFEYIFTNGCFDIEKEALEKSHIKVRIGLNDLVNSLKLASVVKNAFFKASKNRLLVYSVVFKSDLLRMGIDTDELRIALSS